MARRSGVGCCSCWTTPTGASSAASEKELKKKKKRRRKGRHHSSNVISKQQKKSGTRKRRRKTTTSKSRLHRHCCCFGFGRLLSRGVGDDEGEEEEELRLKESSESEEGESGSGEDGGDMERVVEATEQPASGKVKRETSNSSAMKEPLLLRREEGVNKRKKKEKSKLGKGNGMNGMGATTSPRDFQYCGIPLQCPSDYYEFLMRLSTSSAADLTDAAAAGWPLNDGYDVEWDWQKRYEQLRRGNPEKGSTVGKMANGGIATRVLAVGKGAGDNENGTAGLGGEDDGSKKRKKLSLSKKKKSRAANNPIKDPSADLLSLAAVGQTRSSPEWWSSSSGGQSAKSTLPRRHSTSAPIPPALYGVVRVKLERGGGEKQKQPQQLGLGIAGGGDRPIPPTISYIRPGYMAHRCDQLQVGDRLVAVNGRQLANLSHEEVMQLVRSSGPTLCLEVEYDLNGMYFRRPRSISTSGQLMIRQKTTEIILEKDFDALAISPLLGSRQAHSTTPTAAIAATTRSSGTLFGMTIRGGAYGPDSRKSRPITVTAIRAGGSAHREGRLRVGDRLLAVNGVDVTQSTLSMANNLLRETLGPRAHLTVEYDCSVLESLRRAKGVLLLEVEKVPGVDFGLVLTMRWRQSVGERWVLVEKVIRASVADRCGAIHPGDVLRAIDGISLELASNLDEVYQLLRSECPLLRLELLPAGLASQLATRQDATTPTRSSSIKAASLPCVEANGSITARLERPRRLSYSAHAACSSNSSLYAASQPTSGEICHAETMEVILQRPSSPVVVGAPQDPQHHHHLGIELPLRIESGGGTYSGTASCPETTTTSSSTTASPFGISLQRLATATANGSCVGASDIMGESCNARGTIYISAIERNSPAGRSGLLQVGDRVVAINDWFTANGTLEEARHVLQHSGLNVTLLVEFDVLEPILPQAATTSDGGGGDWGGSLVTVKLAKTRGNNSQIGIVCRSEMGGRKGEPVVIADIRTGSVAHRCGALQVGDRIHSIDGVSLDSCSVEEAMRLLQRSSGTVKLTIMKGGGGCGAEGAEEEPSTPMLPYTATALPDLVESPSDSFSAPPHSNPFHFHPPSPAITYTIELQRPPQQPLGLTITSVTGGGGANNEPVVISQLAPGGLAERTGALHLGDQLIAINGESLHHHGGVGVGQKVQRAIHLLQQPNGGKVQLKVRRFAATSQQPQQHWPVPSFATSAGQRFPLLGGNQPQQLPSYGEYGMMVGGGGGGHLPLRLIGSNLSTIQSVSSVTGGGDGSGIVGTGNSDDGEGSAASDRSPLKSVDSAVDSLDDSPDTALAKKLARALTTTTTDSSTAASCSPPRPKTTESTPLKRPGNEAAANNRPSTSTGAVGMASGPSGGAAVIAPDVISGGSASEHGVASGASSAGGWDSGMSSAAETTGSAGGMSNRTAATMTANAPTHQDFRGHGLRDGRWGNRSCCACRNKSSQLVEAGAKEDWMRILEALETVGEEEMLRKLEESIIQMGTGPRARGLMGTTEPRNRMARPFSPILLSGTTSNASPTILRKTAGQHPNTATASNYYACVMRKQNNPLQPPIPPARSRSQGPTRPGGGMVSMKSIEATPLSTFNSPYCPPPLPTTSTLSTTELYANIPYICSSNHSPLPSSMISPSLLPPTSTSQQLPRILSPQLGLPNSNPSADYDHHHQIFILHLRKSDPDSQLGYGFSVSDGRCSPPCSAPSPNVNEESPQPPPNSLREGTGVVGIYVSAVLEGSVAAVAGLRPMDRLLRVNGTSMDCLDCDLAVPLLAAADELELVVMRRRREGATAQLQGSTGGEEWTSTSRSLAVMSRQSVVVGGENAGGGGGCAGQMRSIVQSSV